MDILKFVKIREFEKSIKIRKNSNTQSTKAEQAHTVQVIAWRTVSEMTCNVTSGTF